MAERTKATVLKTVEPLAGSVGSNPTPSAGILRILWELLRNSMTSVAHLPAVIVALAEMGLDRRGASVAGLASRA